MTLRPKTPADLDALALRCLDLAAEFRRWARLCREQGLEQVVLHDGKASAWLDNLAEWSAKTDTQFRVQLARQRGRQRAAEIIPKPDHSGRSR